MPLAEARGVFPWRDPPEDRATDLLKLLRALRHLLWLLGLRLSLSVGLRGCELVDAILHESDVNLAAAKLGRLAIRVLHRWEAFGQELFADPERATSRSA